MAHQVLATRLVVVARPERRAAFTKPGAFGPGSGHGAKRVLAQLVDRFGFDVVDIGPLSDTWRIQRDTPGGGPRRTADELRADLAAAPGPASA